jgi:hypothetical protein
MTRRRSIDEVLAHHVNELMQVGGVAGTGQSWLDDAPCIVVMVEQDSDEVRSKLPEAIEGYRVQIVQTGQISALDD